MSSSIGLWVGFTAIVLVLLILDLGVFHREAREVSRKEAGIWSLVWIGLSLVFNAGIYYTSGSEPALEFLAGYLIEKSLSVDNIFVFFADLLLLFRSPGVSAPYSVLGDSRCARHARYFHCRRGDAAALFPLGHVCLWGLPDLHRRQDCCL